MLQSEVVGSKSPATLKKELFPTVFNDWKIFTFVSTIAIAETSREIVIKWLVIKSEFNLQSRETPSNTA